mmetsp:Transcript_2813/g.11088  ORF Transcript_2813/g.11088 Transcript_2813/m.11088 type:complete len:266 (+) Transcript_2813:983-1780(+)
MTSWHLDSEAGLQIFHREALVRQRTDQRRLKRLLEAVQRVVGAQQGGARRDVDVGEEPLLGHSEHHVKLQRQGQTCGRSGGNSKHVDACNSRVLHALPIFLSHETSLQARARQRPNLVDGDTSGAATALPPPISCAIRGVSRKLIHRTVAKALPRDRRRCILAVAVLGVVGPSLRCRVVVRCLVALLILAAVKIVLVFAAYIVATIVKCKGLALCPACCFKFQFQHRIRFQVLAVANLKRSALAVSVDGCHLRVCVGVFVSLGST